MRSSVLLITELFDESTGDWSLINVATSSQLGTEESIKRKILKIQERAQKDEQHQKELAEIQRMNSKLALLLMESG